MQGDPNFHKKKIILSDNIASSCSSISHAVALYIFIFQLLIVIPIGTAYSRSTSHNIHKVSFKCYKLQQLHNIYNYRAITKRIHLKTNHSQFDQIHPFVPVTSHLQLTLTSSSCQSHSSLIATAGALYANHIPP